MSAMITTITLRACLRLRAYHCVTPDGQRGMRLALRDVSGVLADDMSAQWVGPDAAAYLDLHQAELVPGRCVDIEVYHISIGQLGELKARIKSCALAPLPPSWVKAWPTAPHPSTTTTEQTA